MCKAYEAGSRSRAVLGKHVFVQEAVKVEAGKDVVIGGDVELQRRIELTFCGVLVRRARRRDTQPIR